MAHLSSVICLYELVACYQLYRHTYLLGRTTALSIDGVQVSPVTSVRNLGILINSDLVMRSHVQRTVSGCFAALRQLRQIRNSVPTATFQSLVAALVLYRLDYGNSVLVGLLIHLVRRLKSVQNAATRLICRLRRFDLVPDALVSLHWLRVPERVVYKICFTLFFIFLSFVLVSRSFFPASLF